MSRHMRGAMVALLWLGISLAAHAQTTVEYIHTDALGTPIAVTDANKVVIETTEYEPYGAQVAGPVKDGPGFTGHVQDAATGLTYMQQRYYDPAVGRFLSVDPVTAHEKPGQNFNRYLYANNSPFNFKDPDGRDEEWFSNVDPMGNPGFGNELGDDAFRTSGQALLTAAYGAGTLPSILRAIAAPFVKAGADEVASSAKSGDLHAPGDAPDGTVIVRGGSGDMPAPGSTFSGSQGGTVREAAAGVPHGTIRTSTAGEIRAGGGQVQVAPEPTRSGQINGQHVNVREGGKSTFSEPQPNPVPKPERIK
jgi:RHS repeat-associated protein